MSPTLLKRLKITGITLGIIIGIIVIALVVIYIIDYISYKPYEKKLKDWGFTNIYGKDNFIYGTVKNGEATNALIKTLYDPYNVKEFGYKSNINSEFGKIIKFAEVNNIIANGDITDKNINKSIKIDKMNEYLNSAIYNILNKEDKYEIYGMLGQERSVLSYITKSVFKRDFNIVIIKLVEKYSLIDVENREIAVANFPTNVADYPYIVTAIPAEVYQMNYIVDENKQKEFKKPKDLFNVYKSIYSQIKSRVEEYYNTILNVDYSNLDEDKFKNSIEQLMQFKGAEKGYEEYFDYVKENKITVKGKATALIPILYYDGSSFRIRTRLEFSVNGTKKENLLFGDKINNIVEYQDSIYDIYIDVPLEQSLITDSLYVTINSPLKNQVTYTPPVVENQEEQ